MSVPYPSFILHRMSLKQTLEETIAKTKELMKDSVLGVIIEKSEEGASAPGKKRKRDDDSYDIKYNVNVYNKEGGALLSSESIFIHEDDSMSYRYMIHHLRSICARFAAYKVKTAVPEHKPGAKKTTVSLYFLHLHSHVFLE